MSTLDEITKEKQRIGDAPARVDAHREKLTSQLSKLEATERVLTRYSRGAPARRTASGNSPTHSNTGGRSRATTRAPAHNDRNTSWRASKSVMGGSTPPSLQEFEQRRIEAEGAQSVVRGPVFPQRLD
jgi:hypothetical protein